MSKPLSEQVADLEATNDALWRDLSDMRRERDRLTDNYDKLKAENVELRDSRKRWHDRFLEAIRERNALDADNQDLRAGQGRWPEHDDSPAGEQVPRVITADELKLGMWAAIKSRDEEDEGLWFAARIQPSDLGPGGIIFEGDTIVLLEDAPDPEPTVVHDDDGKPWSVEVRPVAAPAPRLTVHQLNTAPVGSQLEIKSTVFIKTAKGGWSTYNDGVVGYPSEYMIRNGWANATLTHPEEVTPEPEPTSRLTRHQLNTAPLRSTVSTRTKAWTKDDDGKWLRVTAFGQHTRTSEELHALVYANATLSYPERGDDE